MWCSSIISGGWEAASWQAVFIHFHLVNPVRRKTGRFNSWHDDFITREEQQLSIASMIFMLILSPELEKQVERSKTMWPHGPRWMQWGLNTITIGRTKWQPMDFLQQQSPLDTITLPGPLLKDASGYHYSVVSQLTWFECPTSWKSAEARKSRKWPIMQLRSSTSPKPLLSSSFLSSSPSFP